MKKTLFVLVLLVAFSGLAMAQGVEKGQREVNFAFGYFDAKISDVSTKAFTLVGQAGWFVTDNLVVGGQLGYINAKMDVDDSDLKATAWMIGPYVQWHFMPKQKWTPFVGFAYNQLHAKGERNGDESDNLLKNRWELQAGIKYYPVKNVGITAGVSYGKIKMNEDLTDDNMKVWSLTSGLIFVF